MCVLNTCPVSSSVRYSRHAPLCWPGESTTDHLDILDDNPMEREDAYPFEHHDHNHNQPRGQNHQRHPRHPSSYWAEQRNGGGEANIAAPWNDDGGASANLSKMGRAKGRRFEESWEGGGVEGEGRAWKHEDLKQLLQVCRPCRSPALTSLHIGGSTTRLQQRSVSVQDGGNFFCVLFEPIPHTPCGYRTKLVVHQHLCTQDLEDTEYGAGGAKRGRGRGRRRSRTPLAGGSATGEDLILGYMAEGGIDGAPARPPGSGWRSPLQEGARPRPAIQL